MFPQLIHQPNQEDMDLRSVRCLMWLPNSNDTTAPNIAVNHTIRHHRQNDSQALQCESRAQICALFSPEGSNR